LHNLLERTNPSSGLKKCNSVVNTPLQQQRGCVFCMGHVEELSWRQLVLQFCWQLTGVCTGLKHRGRGITIVNICYQAMANEDRNRLRRHSVSNSDLWSVVMSCISAQ
jgi:hypothetical protein